LRWVGISMKVKAPKGRDYLFLKLIKGATKSSIEPDRKKGCRMTKFSEENDQLYLQAVESSKIRDFENKLCLQIVGEPEVESVYDWANRVFQEDCYLGQVARTPYELLTEDELFILQCAYDGYLVGVEQK
jgi:Fe-S-cluster containining protein